MRALSSLLLVFGMAALIAASPASGPASWVAGSCATASGALRVRPAGRYVSGYFGSIVADALARTHQEPAVVLAWMRWYVDHAHGSGSGVDGVADDVDIFGDEERSRGRPDSTDAYGAVFLTLARHAFEGGDPALRAFVIGRRDDLRRIMDSSLATLQPNGLTFARPQYRIFYTIDNAEVYRGLLDASALFSEAFTDARTAAYYERESRVVKGGIDRTLWDPRTQTFRPYMNQEGTSGAANLTQAYPDALAQTLAVYNRVVDPSSTLAASLLARALPAMESSDDPMNEDRLIALAAQRSTGARVDLPDFTPPSLCVDAAWYLLGI